MILKLNGVTDVNGALAMRNAVLYIDRDDANLPKGSFFLADIYGLEVRDAETESPWQVATSSLPPPTMCMWYGAASGRS